MTTAEDARNWLSGEKDESQLGATNIIKELVEENMNVDEIK